MEKNITKVQVVKETLFDCMDNLLSRLKACEDRQINAPIALVKQITETAQLYLSVADPASLNVINAALADIYQLGTE